MREKSNRLGYGSIFSSTASLQFTEKRPVRVVFDVTVEGSARKVITVRSAIMVHNCLEDPVDIKLENPAQTPGGKVQMECIMYYLAPKNKVKLIHQFSRCYIESDSAMTVNDFNGFYSFNNNII